MASISTEALSIAGCLHQPRKRACRLGLAENLLDQFRRAIDDFGLIGKTRSGGDEASKLHAAFHFIKIAAASCIAGCARMFNRAKPRRCRSGSEIDYPSRRGP